MMRVEGSGLGIQKNIGADGKKGNGVEGIQRQIKEVQQQISALSENTELSPDEKREKKKSLEEQIGRLNQELIQRQMEEKKTEEEKQSREKAAESKQEGKGGTGFTNTQMQAMITVGSAMNQAKAINHVRTSLNGEAHCLKGEIAAIESRGGNPEDLKIQLADLEEKIGAVTASMVGKYGEADKAMKGLMAGYRKKINEDETKANRKPEEFKEISLDPAGEHYLTMNKTMSELMDSYKKNHDTYTTEDTASMALQAYAKLYDEIKNGYAQGSREKWIGTTDGGRRKLSEEEELEFLDQAYARVMEGQRVFNFLQRR